MSIGVAAGPGAGSPRTRFRSVTPSLCRAGVLTGTTRGAPSAATRGWRRALPSAPRPGGPHTGRGWPRRGRQARRQAPRVDVRSPAAADAGVGGGV